MDSTPQPSRARRMTWLDAEGTAWRVEYVTGRWQLSAIRRPARYGSVSAATRAARQRSAPPTGRTSARTGIGTQRRPAPAIRARPLRRRTGTAAQTAAAQVGKRCQLSNRTRHGCIIAHLYDNAPRALPAPDYPWSWRLLRRRSDHSQSAAPEAERTRRADDALRLLEPTSYTQLAMVRSSAVAILLRPATVGACVRAEVRRRGGRVRRSEERRQDQLPVRISLETHAVRERLRRSCHRYGPTVPRLRFGLSALGLFGAARHRCPCDGRQNSCCLQATRGAGYWSLSTGE